MWILLIVVLLLAGGGVAAAAESNVQPQPTAPEPDAGQVLGCPAIFCVCAGGGDVITSDPTTWPGDETDPLWKTAHAIGFAEGANIAGSVPDRLNNPGDLSDGAKKFGAQSHDGSSVTTFPDKGTGWQWLYNKLANIVNGGSSVYSTDMTWQQVAQKWAGNWQSWVNNVTAYVGVNPSDRFGDFFGA